MDPTFKAEQTSMWVESLPKEAISETALVEADEKIDAMTAAHNKLEFESDSLALARDAAQLARLLSEESKSERAARIAKVCHLRQENALGSSLTSKFMRGKCHHRSGPLSDLQDELNKDYYMLAYLGK